MADLSVWRFERADGVRSVLARATITAISTVLLLLATNLVHAQDRRLELAGVFATTFQGELDETDLGLGARVGFVATPLLTFEGEIGFYPSDAPEDVPVTGSRFEALFGVTVGPRYERFSLFGKARAGFVQFAEAPEPVPCIAIFPPPLHCLLAEGRTVSALDLGGGVELYPSQRVLVRVDASSLLLRYPGPAFTRDGEAIAEDAFWRGNLRLTFSLGVRF